MNLQTFFQFLSQIEENIEDHKVALVRQNEDFNTIDAFRLMDSAGQGVVSKA